VVALESTLIAQGLPWPQNLETARAAEEAVRSAGAVPATIAILQGRVVVGVGDAALEYLARASGIRKASSRDLGPCLATRADAATTVSATMRIAHLSGIRVFATGGIGGVHPRTPGAPLDVSADLIELSRTPVAVVCAGAKSILDLPATLEVLETLGVPVLGYRSDRFAAFYVQASELPVSARLDTTADLAAACTAHWALSGAGLLVAQPLQPPHDLPREEFDRIWQKADSIARLQGVNGPALTPFLLGRIAEISDGRTLRANHELIVANARLAGELAVALTQEKP
jgi:pseudouridine-5'-phosphate glycosidase